jgi:hypothetical protein
MAVEKPKEHTLIFNKAIGVAGMLIEDHVKRL